MLEYVSLMFQEVFDWDWIDKLVVRKTKTCIQEERSVGSICSEVCTIDKRCCRVEF